jgi:hypothetical protein
MCQSQFRAFRICIAYLIQIHMIVILVDYNLDELIHIDKAYEYVHVDNDLKDESSLTRSIAQC